jgi:gliding motility-associated-like protein
MKTSIRILQLSILIILANTPSFAQLPCCCSGPDTAHILSVSAACPAPDTNVSYVTVGVAGGAAPYRISYDYGLTFHAPGDYHAYLTAGYTYNIVVRDSNNCVMHGAYSYTVKPKVAVSWVSFSNCFCTCSRTTTTTATALPAGGVGGSYRISFDSGATFESYGVYAKSLSIGHHYYIVAEDSMGCLSSVYPIYIPKALHVKDTFSVFPGGRNISCHGAHDGYINLTVSGATPPYTFRWSNGDTTQNISGLAAGIYSVTITDSNACSRPITVTLTEPAALTPAITATNVSCNGNTDGAAAVSVTGGTAPYTYLWSTSPVQTTSMAAALAAGTYSLTVTDTNGCTATTSVTIAEPSALSAVTTTLSNVSCSGGSNGALSVTPAGGTPPYTYSWATSPVQTTSAAIGLSAGIYSVTVTDAHNCSAIAMGTVLNPVPIYASVTAGNILCNGGTTTITVTGSGGTLPYHGIGTFTVTTGIYHYSITDAYGCAASGDVTVTEPAAISLGSSATNASCTANNGTATVTASGGTPPYSYQWDAHAGNQLLPTATGLTKGLYSVIVTDNNGCAQAMSVNVNSQSEAIALMPEISNPACFNGHNGSIELQPTGGLPPYTCAWSNGYFGMKLSGIDAGSYAVTVTDMAGCVASSSFTITQPQPLTVTLSPGIFPNGYNISINNGADGSVSADVSGGTGPYTYQWSNESMAPALQNLRAGTYSLLVTDVNGCTATAKTLLDDPGPLELPTGYSPNGDGRNDYFVIHGIDAYPNNRLIIYNRWGNEVFTADNYHNTWNGRNLEGKDLPDGTYFVVLIINGGSLTKNGYVDLRR